MKPVRLGVIGLGLIWLRTHQPILQTLKDVFEPVAFCDLSEQRRAVAAQDFPDAPVLSDYQSLLEIPAVETALVLTPLALNAPTALAALQAGKEVIMEKPIARSTAEGRRLVATARQAGRRLFVTEQFAYRSLEETLAEIIASGEIGELVMWEGIQHLDADPARGALRYDSTPWRKSPDYPLGAMFDGGVHFIAGLSKLLGPPETVFATGRRLRPEYGEYDHVAALFRYPNGLVGMLSHSFYLPPPQNHFRLYGARGVIVVQPDRIVVEKPDRPDRVVALPPDNDYVRMWQALARAYQENNEPYYTAEKALRDVTILEAVDQSIKTGRPVRIV